MKKLYLDMDGVICDFEGCFSAFYGQDVLKNRDKKLWTQEWPNFILEKKGFETLTWWPGGEELVKFAKGLTLKGIEVEILTSSGGETYHNEVGEQKRIWLKNHGIDFKPNVVPGRRHKKDYAGKGIVLVDDTEDVIKSFNKAGGIGILHKDIGDTLEKLKSLLA